DMRYRIAQRGVEYRPQPGIDSAFHLQEKHCGVAHPVQKPRTSIGTRHWAADVRIHNISDGRTIWLRGSRKLQGEINQPLFAQVNFAEVSAWRDFANLIAYPMR